MISKMKINIISKCENLFETKELSIEKVDKVHAYLVRIEGENGVTSITDSTFNGVGFVNIGEAKSVKGMEKEQGRKNI